MLSPLELLERERLNHLHFIENYRDPADAQYLRDREIEKAVEQIKQLDAAIQILNERRNQ